MKRLKPRYRGLGMLFLLSVLVFSIFSTVLLKSPTAYASGEQYVFNYASGQKNALDTCLKNQNCSDSELANMYVFVRGGVFGPNPIQLNYEPYFAVTDNPPPIAFTGNYNCQNYSISLVVTIHNMYALGDVEATHYQGRVWLDNIRNTTTGEDTSNISNGQDSYLPQSSSESDVPTIDKSGLPSICEPGNLSVGTNNATVDILNYNLLSPAQQQPWGGGAATPAPPSSASSSGTGTATKQLGCDVQFTNPLTWIICPAVGFLSDMVNAFDNIITNQLNIKTDAIFCDTSNTCKAYYSAWQAFRDIALGLLAIVGLVIVIAQALGMEILDAYTIRKILPRLLVATIGIALSWPLMKFLIQLSDDLGFGIRHLIYYPFAGLSDTGHLTFGNQIADFFLGGGIAVAGGVAAWVEFGGLGALILFALSAALAVAVAVATLTLRQVLIILMMLLAPIAIIAYVLPNTQRIYRLWWESFSKALLMFPMIAAMIATGRVFSAITFHNGGFINQLIGFIAYFAPYFMIPMTFRMSGAALGAMGNFINSRAQPGFAALGKKRGEIRAARHTAARRGGLYRNAFGKFQIPTFNRDKNGRRTLSRNPETGRRFGWRETSVDKMLNAITNNTIDAQDVWRVQAARRGGAVGRALFGRQARDLEDKIERQSIEHTANAAKVLQGRYHTARAVGGAFGYYYDNMDAEGQQALRNNFGIGERDENGNLSEESWQKAGSKFRGTENEKEDMLAASILEHGDQGAKEAATELRASAITLSTFKGAGKDDTQRFNRSLWSMMVRGQAGRLENNEIADYFNQRSAAVGREKAYLETKQIQTLAAGKRTSQAEGYGLEYKVVPDGHGGSKTIAVDVYDDPAGVAAQKSFGRTSTADLFNGKSEDFKDPEGDLSGWAQTIIAATSDYKTKTVDLTRVNPATGREEVVINPRTGQPKKRVISTGEMKNQQELLDAQAARAKLQSGEGYAQGDTGVGGMVYRIMQDAEIDPKYGHQSRAKDPKVQAAAGYKGKVILPSGVDPGVEHDQLPPQFQPNPAAPPPEEPPPAH